MKRLWIRLILCLCLLALLVLYGLYENTQLDVSYYRVEGRLEGIRIAHVSDLHNAQIGPRNKTLVEAIRKAKPDLIFLTGDMFDGRHPNRANSIDFLEQIADLAPLYYVPGNHEAYVPQEYRLFRKQLKELQVHVLENRAETIPLKGQDIVINGIVDCRFFGNDLSEERMIAIVKDALTQLRLDSSKPNLLLSHRPERMAEYAAAELDYVFSGHAHGGQFRIGIPLFAPGQGLFPKYAQGVIREQNTALIVSRGLGNSIIPLRLGNRPELVVVDLVKKHD